MRPAIAIALLLTASLSAQTRRPPAHKPPPAAPPKTITPETACPTQLGVGVKTRVAFCEVMAGRDPAGGVLVTVPPHKGPATLSFDLHNLHTYSEEQVKAKRAFTRYTATIGVLTMDNTLLSRAVVQTEFRTAADLIDRVSGGAGPGGVKAVAPTGTEAVSIEIPEGEDKVSLLGEKLTVDRMDGTATYTQAGRPIAVVSNLTLEYRPGPPPKPAPPAKSTTTKKR
ncbi:MAG TPA: hypothetical protein VKE96_34865 [Vicinamibacterales bacterium]|nr:hypothetical protein [Vicinamibacterales bacterium]